MVRTLLPFFVAMMGTLCPHAVFGQTMPLPADSVADSVGIVDHVEFNQNKNTPPNFVYGDLPGVCDPVLDCYDKVIQPWIAASGIRHIRGPAAWSNLGSGHQAVVAHRVNELTTLPMPSNGCGHVDETVVLEHGFNPATIASNYLAANSCWADVEGDNEPDLASELCNSITANQITLWNAMHAILPTVPVWGPSLTIYGDIGWRQHCAPLGPYENGGGNWHTYMPGGLPLNPEALGNQAGGPPTDVQTIMGFYLSHCQGIFAAPPYSGSGPACNITEMGMRTCQPGEVNKSQNGIQCVSQAIAARYAVRWVMFNKIACNTEAPTACGWGRMFFHQIADNHGPAVNTTTGKYDPQSGYGVAFDWVGVPKPAGAALKNLVALFNDPVPFTPTPLTYSVARLSGNTAQPFYRLYQKSTGAYMLPIWLGLPGWGTDSTGAYQLKLVASEVVQLTLPPTVTSAKITLFNDNGTVTTATRPVTGGVIDITVTDQLKVIVFQ